MSNIVVFDFDGVVCDSTNECMVTSWNAWDRWSGGDNYRRTIAEFSPEEDQRFRRLRPFVKGAGEYYALRRVLQSGESESIISQDQHAQLCQQWAENCEKFKPVFFKQREWLRQQDLKKWIQLHPVFPSVIDTMIQLQQQNRLYIATLKDAESVKLVLQMHGLEISDDRMLDQSQIKNKLEALDTIRQWEGCAKQDMVFIDDNISHLMLPKANGYRVFQTTWGNVPEENLVQANKAGIELLRLAEISELFE